MQGPTRQSEWRARRHNRMLRRAGIFHFATDSRRYVKPVNAAVPDTVVRAPPSGMRGAKFFSRTRSISYLEVDVSYPSIHSCILHI